MNRAERHQRLQVLAMALVEQSTVATLTLKRLLPLLPERSRTGVETDLGYAQEAAAKARIALTQDRPEIEIFGHIDDARKRMKAVHAAIDEDLALLLDDVADHYSNEGNPPL